MGDLNGNRQRSLLNFAHDCEDAAAGLHRFRDALPRHATRITALVSELFRISALLRQIHNEEGSRSHGPAFYRINDDLALVFRSLRLTLDDVFEMFARSQDREEVMVWEDLSHQHESVERYGLLERLEWYHDFLGIQLSVLEGQRVESPRPLRENITALLVAQQRTQRQNRRLSISDVNMSGASTPRPRRHSRPPMPPRINTPSTTTVISDDWDAGWERPMAPEPPMPGMFPPTSPMSPISHTFTSFSSGSSQTISSQTSYSSDPYAPSPLVHWARNVFDGTNPTTFYSSEYQLTDRSVCHGEPDPSSLEHLTRDGFQRALELSFDQEKLWVRFYWRPSDHRARILIMSLDSHGRQLHYCQPMTRLKVIRRGSTLQLCRGGSREIATGRYKLWARLNFALHERMVLFYSTFVAMKHQDKRGIDHPALIDNSALDVEDGEGESLVFAGEMQHADMLHALRVLRDRGSGTVRLEASALRGPRKTVPIWTAFVTRYIHDPDWPYFEGNGVVSLAAIRPADPFVFISRYQPPKNVRGNWVLPFTTDEDARMFVEAWAGLCRRFGR